MTEGNEQFSSRLIAWHRPHGRHDLPWQNTTDAYRVWLSEIMLQQTQVATVIPYYVRFLQRFPTLADLAAAPAETVMAAWSGLGYYARARNLHRAAQAVMAQYGGEFPRTPEALVALPGIGRSTANSIATFCFAAQAPILDGNVKRVFCRYFGIEGFPGSAAVEKRLWALAESMMPVHDGGIYNQAQMDLGSTVCTRGKPRCEQCPLAELCVARQTGRTTELPLPRPRTRLPERAVTVLVLLDPVGRVLLETRAPSGIWGGMQSLPEMPDAFPEPADWLRTWLAGELVAVSPAPTFTHVFSHFRLHIRPRVVRFVPQPMLMEARWQWLDPGRLKAAALPAPVRSLLEKIQAGESSPQRAMS